MPTFTNYDFKIRRESLGIHAPVLAEKVPFDADTIYKIESGKRDVNPDEMYLLAVALGDVGIWHQWMRTKYPASYGREHPEMPQYDLKGCILALYSEMADVEDLRKELMRDGADGKIDDPELMKRVCKEATELMGVVQRFLNMAKERGDFGARS